MASHDIALLGAGVNGITTATVLQESGFRTTIYAHLRADKDTARDRLSEFASIYPAACIVPHSVEGSNVLELFGESQDTFARLARLPETGVRWQEHYELSASETVELPSYTRALADCGPYEGRAGQLPFDRVFRRKLSGWVARVLFAEMPVYLGYLFRRYLLSGGRIVPRQLQREDLPAIPASIIINCTGLWARSLFRDSFVHPVRGHLIFARNAPFPPLPNRLFSYNYKPTDQEYAYDVYFFPRSGDGGSRGRGWLFGGSRETGYRGSDGHWHFEEGEKTADGGTPPAINDLNRKILLHLTGVDIDNIEKEKYAGFRPGRTGGIRLEASQEEGVTVIHNYGHGGAGVALSWGCALRVLWMVQELTGRH